MPLLPPTNHPPSAKDPVKQETPSDNTFTRVHVAQADRLKAAVEMFAQSNDYFRRLPRNLKDVAMGVAVETLQLPAKDLLLRAGELDALDGAMARFDREKSGGLIADHKELRKHLVEFDLDKMMEAQRMDALSLAQLRQGIASRQARIDLAREIGGPAPQVVLREDFKLANDLAWQAVRELTPTLAEL